MTNGTFRLLRTRYDVGGAAGVALLIREMLLGRVVMPIGQKPLDTLPDDIIIAALESDSLGDGIREAVLAGCREVYAELLADLAKSGSSDRLDVAAIRLSRVVDVLAPRELQPLAEAYFRLALAQDNSEVAKAAARAAASYAGEKTALPLWRSALARPELAGYAFNVVVKLDSRKEVVAEDLSRLWLRNLRAGWGLDCPFLARRMVRSHGEQFMLRRALQRLREDLSREEVASVKSELLRRPWSKEWVAFLEEDDAEKAVPALPDLQPVLERLLEEVERISASRSESDIPPYGEAVFGGLGEGSGGSGDWEN